MTQPPEYPPPTPYGEQSPTPYGEQPPAMWQPYPQPSWSPSPPVPTGTNGLAIAALVTAILGTLCFSSIVLGIVALVQTSRTKQQGKGLAIAALVISALWLVGALVVGVVAAVTSQDDRSQATEAAIAGSEDVSTYDLAVGDCLITAQLDDVEEDPIDTLPSVPCSERHDTEVYAIVTMTGTDYRSQDELIDYSQNRCDSEFARVLPKDTVDDYDLGTFFLYPTEEGWADGDRDLTCMVTTDDLRTGSLRD